MKAKLPIVSHEIVKKERPSSQNKTKLFEGRLSHTLTRTQFITKNRPVNCHNIEILAHYLTKYMGKISYAARFL